MKKIKYLLSLLLFTQITLAQTGFTPKVEKYIDAYIASFDQSKPELKKINLWYANFKKAEKPSKEDYERKLIGLGIEITKEKEGISRYLSASYLFDKNKIAIKKIEAKKYEQDLIDSYSKAYFKNNSALKKETIYKTLANDNFAFGARNFKENTQELYVKGSFNLYYYRVYKEHLYVLSINSNYNIWKNRAIAFYKFDLSLDNGGTYDIPKVVTKTSKPKKATKKASYTMPNRWENKNRLFHDVATDELRETVVSLAQIAPYVNDKDFVANAQALNTLLTRDNVKDYISQLQFFENYKVELADEIKQKLGYYARESVENVNHYASHALSDVYMNQKEYEKAVSSFEKALKNKYHTASGTRYIRCLNRIYLDLAEAAFALDHADIGVLYLLAIIAEQNTSSEYADEQLTAYGKTINAKKFKEYLVLAINSVKLKGELEYTITYKNQLGTFEIPLAGSKKNIQIRLIKSNTYSYFENQ